MYFGEFNQLLFHFAQNNSIYKRNLNILCSYYYFLNKKNLVKIWYRNLFCCCCCCCCCCFCFVLFSSFVLKHLLKDLATSHFPVFNDYLFAVFFGGGGRLGK